MRLIKIDADYYNLDKLIKAEVDEVEAELIFPDAIKITVPIEHWQYLIKNESVWEYIPEEDRSPGIFFS